MFIACFYTKVCTCYYITLYLHVSDTDNKNFAIDKRIVLILASIFKSETRIYKQSDEIHTCNAEYLLYYS